MKTAYFNHFTLEIPEQAVIDCAHSGPCDSDVDAWANKVARPEEITKERLSKELKEYGAWDEKELLDDIQNWKRLIWIAAGNVKEESDDF
jgi:membrane protein required for beta-lactamase induction